MTDIDRIKRQCEVIYNDLRIVTSCIHELERGSVERENREKVIWYAAGSIKAAASIIVEETAETKHVPPLTIEEVKK